MNLLYYLFIKATSKANQKEGFTLLEVIVTMVVMALLATLAMPTIQKSYDRFRLDTAIVQLHKDIRWAQKLADREQGQVSITFFQDKQPYRYVIQTVSDRTRVKTVEMPNGLTAIQATTIFINPDKTFMKNGHVLIRKGEVRRYVYYYQTGRSRVTSIPD